MMNRFLGTSGQNINNLERFMNVDNMLELAENTLHWRHLAPTAPDQLHCYPFYDYDPFIIERCPHVYFIGNQKELKTKLIHGLNNFGIFCL
jgi:DNA polymerase delta subunit 2